eukprot:11218263-Lingulodinium_polyedra.AAC.1
MRRSTTTSRRRCNGGGATRRDMGWRRRAYGWPATSGTCAGEALSPRVSCDVAFHRACCC